MKDVLELDGIYLEYDLAKILTGIHVKCETGQIIGLLGRNGSGKSSLMRIVFGSLEAQSKSIRINEVSQLKSFNRNISYLPQEALIPSFISIQKALKLFNIDPQCILDVFPEARESIRLKPNEISGGMRKIIEVMLILNTNSKFALLDEPFSGIMPVHIETLKDYMWSKKNEKGIIITDHLYRHVMELSDTLYVLANGKNYIVNDEQQLITRGYVREL